MRSVMFSWATTTRTGPPPVEAGAPPADHLRRRSSQWLVLAVLVLAMVATVVLIKASRRDLPAAEAVGVVA